jgi:hypothetical protein
VYIPNFMKIGSAIQKLIAGDTQTQRGDLISLLLFFQNKESGLKVGHNNKYCILTLIHTHCI